MRNCHYEYLYEMGASVHMVISQVRNVESYANCQKIQMVPGQKDQRVTMGRAI